MPVPSLSNTPQTPTEPVTTLENLAHQLARNHARLKDPSSKPRSFLLKHLPNWEQALQDAYQSFKGTSLKDLANTRASEWMLDNYYVVEQTFHQIKQDLPKGFFNQLPKIEKTELNGYPRVFALAMELVGYSRAQLDLDQVTAFVQDYQQVTPLMIGELWALPTMLRIGILEHLVAAITHITGGVASERLNAHPVLPVTPSMTDNEAIVANCFRSLRLLMVTDWNEFFEQTSRIEQILRQDPAGIYPDMDFDTRNCYRNVIEELARHSQSSEETVAQAVVAISRKAQRKSPASHKTIDRKTHIGYYLVDSGLPQLEANLAYHPGLKTRLRKAVLAHPTFVYLGSIVSLSLLIVAGLTGYAHFSGGSPAQLILTGLLGCGLALEAAINLVNWNVTHRIAPRTLPRMDFSKGIPTGYRTMVVIPTLLASTTELDSLLQSLELHYLRNPDPQLTFALLSDFNDAPAQQMPEDEPLLALARTGVENLNHKYGKAAPFYLFHREREWNHSEGVWMGWERKRGKLAEFNRLLLNAGPTTYSTQVGKLKVLHNIRYVITLDADTSLTQGSASRLIATLAHPLNRAEFAADGCTVSAGYTVLQPRVEIKPSSANRSRFSQIYAGNAGFDLYTLAVSDVYQDLFGEGSYVGKGIYDVAAFERSLAGQVRENTLLSHDLFEGIYGRAALVTDVILYEEFPARYLGYSNRLQRWIRGDWQLLPWLFPTVRTELGNAPNRLSVIDRWKIFDNLRRSLLAPITLAFYAAAWLILPGSPLFWTILLLLVPALTIAAQTIQHVRQNIFSLSFKELFTSIRLPLIQWALAILFLPYEALLRMNAIGITLSRLLVTRRNMLQWTTAAHFASSFRNTRYKTWWEMALSTVFSLLLGFAIGLDHPSTLLVALPLLVGWAISPQIAYWISKPIRYTSTPLSESQRKRLQRLARRTWAYFEQFAGPDDHWLPPDHFQKNPRGFIAHYTTPTNIGMFLLSTLSAYDLGYIGLFELSVRLRNTFENMDKLKHYRGHLMNWYDTQTMTPLPPRYISTVDSGNLAACLIALKQGCLALTDTALVGKQQWQGLLAILDILTDILKDLDEIHPDSAFEPFEVELDAIRERITAARDEPRAWPGLLAWLSSDGWVRISRHLISLLENAPVDLDQEILKDLQLYQDTLHQQLNGMQRTLKLLAPWIGRINQPPRLFAPAGRSPLKAWQEFLDSLPAGLPSLGNATETYNCIQSSLAKLQEVLDGKSGPPKPIQEARTWCRRLNKDLVAATARVGSLQADFRNLAKQADTAVNAMNFKFLFNDQRQAFHIGYNASTEKLDTSFYDLLASEARIASLIAIAKHDVPQRHWQHLGRPVTRVNGKQVLLSWSGTMFEYLMPALLSRNYAGTFLSDSCYVALDAQMNYGREKGIPWGVSESGYYAFDKNMNYQYRAFGVPELGYKRDLPDDVVIAPYASLLGLSMRPQSVLSNLARLESLKMLGRYGLYEALDHTRTRLPMDQEYAIVQSYMAHHQGMILLAICNYLTDDVMIRRFHADEYIQSVELLLQEKIPQNPHIEYPHPEETVQTHPAPRAVPIVPWRVPVDSSIPQVHFLTQGRYGVLITNSGSGYSQWDGLALTRWQSDPTLDNWGTWIYLQDLDSGALWSTTCQPIGCPPENQEVLFYPHKAEFRRWDQGISLHTEITVAADDVEIRRVTVLNDSDRTRRLKFTSYGEVVLAQQSVDRSHPAFNKLFIESEYLPSGNALLFHRRSRSADEKPVYLAHALVIKPGYPLTGEYESDRARFLGRGRTPESPVILQQKDGHLSGTTGETLDPILSLAQAIDLKPHTNAQLTFITLAARSRAEALERVERYQSQQVISQAFDEARTHSERELAELDLSSTSLEHIQQLLSALLYPGESLRASPAVLAKNRQGQPGLWAHGISGDYPILLLHARDGDNPLVLEALQAFSYWHKREIKLNLVILNDQDTGYAMDFNNKIHRQIVSLGADAWLFQRDGIFLLRSDQIANGDRALLETVAGVILDSRKGTLAEHARRLSGHRIRLPRFTPSLPKSHVPESTPALIRPTGLQMDNGLGGFSPDGKEYVVFLQPGQNTPRPWINVIANPEFGFMVSEAGSGPTWAGNSGENRLTPWRNDPVSDTPGEALYLRDEETGLVWSPTPLPAGADTACEIRHGAGYSTFESQSHGLGQYLRLFAATDAPVKIAHLRLENKWARPRRITVTYYAEWVLGTTRDACQAYIIPEFDPTRHALLASNRYNTDFGERTAFLAASKMPHGLTADRTEFLGLRGSLRDPAALGRIGLSSTVRAGLNPCAAIQLHVDLAPGQVEEIYFLLGEGKDRQESLALITKYQDQDQIELAWQAVHHLWNDLLGGILVQTPDAGMDLMLNRWLLYQTVSCRLWARSALYQSGGAYGFRDQLQDVLAVLQTQPGLAREQILNAAQHQFEAGDVLHWWHPPSGRGVRTRFSDDLLWLPFVTAGYVAATGDAAILDEQVAFLKAEELKPEEGERYGQFESTSETFSLFEHCRRALEKGSTAGIHGLPRMGSGDWNDGMNLVGAGGRGESVWLGWFLHATLTRFANLCTIRKDDPQAYLQQAADLARALETHAWDGDWYLRAFYDDGTKLGASRDDECRIDAISQSWAVLSRAADPQRAAHAMESVNQHLIREVDRLVLLLAPPFDKTQHNPGYIKGYPPGVRENGGQYTHAALWTTWAFADLGQGDRAGELFHLLNPIYHGDTPDNVARYELEPYAVAADIYSQAPHTGKGGWSWYTGSASWMYRLGVEGLLGISRAGNTLKINPCIPASWPGFQVTYRFGATHYHIRVENPAGVNQGIREVLLDGKQVASHDLTLVDDQKPHAIQVLMG
jgi:cyclic beta-1,2-glucan synthetase